MPFSPQGCRHLEPGLGHLSVPDLRRALLGPCQHWRLSCPSAPGSASEDDHSGFAACLFMTACPLVPASTLATTVHSWKRPLHPHFGLSSGLDFNTNVIPILRDLMHSVSDASLALSRGALSRNNGSISPRSLAQIPLLLSNDPLSCQVLSK